ncbi:MAG: hypothetical protein ACFB9M_15940 [Myxococcota bacterium]
MARKGSSSSWIAAAWLFVSPSLGSAYIDGVPVLLEKAAAKRAAFDLDSLVALGHRFEGEQKLEVWEGYRVDMGFRREVRQDSDVNVTLIHRNRIWSFRAGQTAQPRRTRPNLFQTFIVHNRRDPSGQVGLLFLQAYGIDPSIVSLHRQDRRPVYIIGAKPWEPDKPQLWLDKELLVPVRLVHRDDGVKSETRLYGFDSPITGPFYPERIEEWRGEDLIRSTVFDRVDLNPALDARRFDAPT